MIKLSRLADLIRASLISEPLISDSKPMLKIAAYNRPLFCYLSPLPTRKSLSEGPPEMLREILRQNCVIATSRYF